jgi:branched-chain amino acid aminotransferase
VTNTERVLWINSRLIRLGAARLDPRDRGFTLGDGIFETMRVTGGAVQRLDRHLVRLRAGAVAINLPLPWTDMELTSAVARTLAANGLQEAAVRLTVSRGVPTTRGLLPDPNSVPSLVIDAREFPGYPAPLYAQGMNAITSRIRRNEHSPLANVKALCYLDNVLARHEAAKQGADEALLSNTAGYLVCASAANLFIVLSDTLVAPPLSAGALPGTVRHVVLTQLAPRLKLTVSERPMTVEDLARADEAFLTSALLGVMPLTTVDGRSVGTGKPGALTLKFGAAFK